MQEIHHQVMSLSPSELKELTWFEQVTGQEIYIYI